MRDKRAQSVSVKTLPRLDLSQFDADLLRDDEIALEVAMSVLDDYLENSAASVDGLMIELCASPRLLEFLLSGE